jgi:hypothetical protein
MALTVPDFGGPRQAALIEYPILHAKQARFRWDRLAAMGDVALTGLTHINDSSAGADGRASLGMTRTPYRELVFAPLLP